MQLTSDRLLFQPYRDEDFPFLMSLLSNPEVVRFIGNGTTKDESGGKDFLHWIYRTYTYGKDLGLMVLVNKKDKTRIGHAGLIPQRVDGKEEIEIGYWIAREYWGKGYASEAAKALLDYGEKHIDQERFIALIQSEHFVSQKVAKKLGMEFDKIVILNGRKVHVYTT
ncbi:Protein N-acetyltransferase, RimJ/RimL family [Salinibacillus kushneri]|uniref:Protein N-acetyltransferase, RimJ/RimL family n=1 Tax=Salinibacillus kushneri TaxID=237682 RepID=A0A1I0EU53_9BACI|nr:GNAT family N-acetyltransferase [Salinibacillus kushneri]SET48953.1 Protein N-acetyltransferase, RimJ/RimL family [Salinibacillus kushneri]